MPFGSSWLPRGFVSVQSLFQGLIAPSPRTLFPRKMGGDKKQRPGIREQGLEKVRGRRPSPQGPSAGRRRKFGACPKRARAELRLDCRLTVIAAATVRSAATTAAMRSAAAGSCVRGWCARCCLVRSRCTGRCGLARRIVALRYCTTSAGPRAAGIVGYATGPAVIITAALGDETMAAPAVAIAPATPGSHAQKDSVVEVSRPVIAVGRAGVG